MPRWYCVKNLFIWHGYPAEAVDIEIGVAEADAGIAAAIKEVEQAKGYYFGIAIKAGGECAAIVTVARFINGVVISNVRPGGAHKIIGQGVGVFREPLLITTEQLGCPV